MAEEQQHLPEYRGLGLGLGQGQGLLRPQLTGVWYNDKSVHIDGYRFLSCRFDNCQLFTSSTNFQLERCFIDPTTIINYGGEAIRLIQLFNCRNEWFYENANVFAPTRHEEGTISIL